MSNLKIKPSKQAEIVNFVERNFFQYDQQMTYWRERMDRIYKAVTTFENTRINPWDTTFKVNKAHTIENKVLPRIVAKQSRWIVKHKSYAEAMSPNVDLGELTEAIQAYLTAVFKKQDLVEVTRLWAKSFIRYGPSWAKIVPKVAIQRTSKEIEQEDDETGQKTIVRKVDQAMTDRCPSMEVLSYTDIYLDPTYKRFEDMPTVIALTRKVRLSQFTKNPKKYMNLKDLVGCCMSESTTAVQDYRDRILNVTGIKLAGNSNIKPDTLEVKECYTYYDLSDKNDMSNERLYKFTTVGGLFLVQAEEISQIPIEDIRCFEDPETYLPTGFLEPILGLQEELNFKKNAKSRYINQSLHRDWIWSPMSGVDPRKLNGGAGNIIMTSVDAKTAAENLQEVAYRQINPDIFSEENDFERQIQEGTFTQDLSNVRSQQGLTNTATGAKLASFDIGAVMDEVRKHYEEGLVRLAYKLLQFTFDNLQGNIYIKELNGSSFREINKEAFRDALSRFEIEVVAGSSSFDSEENERNDALAQWAISKEAQQSGVMVDLEKRYSDVMNTFDGVDKNTLFKQQIPMVPGAIPGGMPQVPGQPPQPPAPPGGMI